MVNLKFDPFVNRLSRDIRNSLSKNFIQSLKQKDIVFVKKEAEKFFSMKIAPVYRDYISRRLACYEQAFYVILKYELEDAFAQALVLWDQELFFEVHELLEGVWMNASGAERKALQGMIRAAGAYVHLEQGHIKAARSMAAKAVAALQEFGKALPSFDGMDLLIEKLNPISPEPPKLSPCS